MKSLSLLSGQLKTPFLLIGLLSLTAINIGFAQNASFSADVTSGCFPLTVKFTDTSNGSISSWEWDFGNGNSSIQQNPGAVYATPGVYTVSLKVSNGSQTDTETKTGYIQVHDYPSVDFSFDKITGCTPLVVQFTDESTAGSGSITNWFWVFGDGGTSAVPSPEYTYTSSGEKSISLKVTNEFGCATTAAKPSAISPSGPVAAFTASSTFVCQVPATIQFSNESTGSGVLSFSWDFGDGTSSTVQNPSHTFTQAGTYPVLLTSRDQQGCEASDSVIISAGSGGGLSYEASAYKVCAGEQVAFTSLADAHVISRVWDFGNNTSSTDTNPSVTYSEAGEYPVTLTALLQGKTCESVVTKTIEVIALPVPSFTHKGDCNYNVTFTNTSLHASRVEWYIHDVLVSTQQSFQHSFSFSGDRVVKLIAYNSLNCNETFEKIVSVPANPIASFSPNLEQDCLEPSLSGCAPFLLQLTNQSSSLSEVTSLWEFGDNTNTTDKDPSHTYATKGTYTLKLTVTNAQGCKGTVSAKVTVADVIPVAKFIFDKAVVCTREEVAFTNQSENATFWCWDFGDDSGATGENVKHSYTKPGIYNVTLTARNAGCHATVIIQNAIEVKDPYIDFIVEKNCNDPYTINIQNLSSGNDSLEWDFGDGTTSDTNETTHHFASTGNYAVKLKGSNTVTGCTTEMSVPVIIQDIRADFEMDNPRPCKGEMVTFADKSEFAVRWNWVLGSSAFSEIQHPTAAFFNAGAHDIVLTAFDSDGCMDQKVLSLNVLDIQGNFTYTSTSSCDELAVQFTDLSTPSPPSISGWLWDFGDGQTSTEQNPHHIYTSLGNFSINLTLTNDEGSCTFIRDGAVIFTNPVPEFFPSKEGACIMETVTLTNASSNAFLFEWDFGDGRTSGDTHTQIDYPATGEYTVTLRATDAYGCTKSLSRTAIISVTKPLADFEAFDTSSECPPLISIFQDKSTGDVQQWHWDFGDGQSSVLANPAYTYVKPGTFDVQLTVTDANGCSDTKIEEQLITIGGPYGSFASGIPGDACVAQTVPFSAVTTNAAIHRWDYGEGTVEETGSRTETHHTYTSPGSHNISLVLIDEKGCQVIAEGDVKVIVNDTTKIDFTYLPECIFEGESFVLAAAAEESDISWEWMIGGKPVGTTPELSLAVDTAGQHQVTLHAINQHGCPSAISHTIPVQGKITFIPNVFTPNHDGDNAYFTISDLEKSKWDIQIYNRYGAPVYEKDNYTNDWDGGDLPVGVYYYSVINSFCRDRSYKGIISIMR